VYKLVAGDTALTSGRRVLAAGIGGYVGINAAALATAIELGIQPALFHAADGTPLYSPYHLAQTIPAMMLAHLVVAGFVEAAVCAGTVAYLQRANLPLLQVNHPDVPVTAEEAAARTTRKVRPWHVALGAIAVMIVLTPLGLLAPGGAFGEDAPEDLNLSDLGLQAIPAGLARWNGWWQSTLFPDYDFKDGTTPWLGYIVSALVGIAVVGGCVYLLVWVINRIARKPEADDEADLTSETTSSTT
jgi:cobalt/nickel transport system permease protein